MENYLILAKNASIVVGSIQTVAMDHFLGGGKQTFVKVCVLALSPKVKVFDGREIFSITIESFVSMKEGSFIIN